MTVIGYQTLEDRNNVEYLETNGPIKCTSKKAWLGHGYYFWDTEIKWAHIWGRNYGRYVIFTAELTIDGSTFDLFGSVAHRKLMMEWKTLLLKRKYFKSADEITISRVIEYVKKHAEFEKNYNSIRAADYPTAQMEVRFIDGRDEYTYLGEERVQHCLLNKNSLTSHSFRIYYPEKYLT